jgi:hypothetical protein
MYEHRPLPEFSPHSPEKKKWRYACKILRTNSLKEGAMWHIHWKPGLWSQQRPPLLGKSTVIIRDNTKNTETENLQSTQPNSFLSTSSQLLCQLPTPKLDSIPILYVWDPRYIVSGWTYRKQRLPYCCVFIHGCRDVFTAQLRSNERGADRERTPLSTSFLLLRDVTTYVTRSSTACVRAIT